MTVCTYAHERGKISSPLNRDLHEFLGLHQMQMWTEKFYLQVHNK